MNIEVGDLVAFSDIPQGAHFKEDRKRGARKFIKLQRTLPSGLKQYITRIFEKPNGDCTYDSDEGKFMSFDTLVQRSFNAIDYEGCGGKCPDWCEFIVTKLPKHRSCK